MEINASEQSIAFHDGRWSKSRISMKDYVRWFSDIRLGDVALVGGKNASSGFAGMPWKSISAGVCMMPSLQLMRGNALFLHLAGFDAPQSGRIKLADPTKPRICGTACGRPPDGSGSILDDAFEQGARRWKRATSWFRPSLP